MKDFKIDKKVTNDVEKQVKYGSQLAMLNKLLALGLISSREYLKIKTSLMKDYKIPTK